MPSTTLKKSVKSTSKAKAIAKNKNYSNDPFFLKKAKDAEAFLKKHGLPKELNK